MTDNRDDLYRKYDVFRCDGTSATGGKHAGCVYYVLDINHDKFAAAALRAYAEECADELPELSQDLLNLAIVNEIETGRRESRGRYFPDGAYAAVQKIR